jgi:hypothetical protein
MKFTMPDKESTPTEYMSDADADFLKRKNVYCEEVGLHFGALDEESIFKSLHSTLRSKFCTPREQAIQNIDGALREWFAHGREVYEMRRAQMHEVATRANLICREIDIDYDTRMNMWKENYFDTQSGLEKDMPEEEVLDLVSSMIPLKRIGKNVQLFNITEIDLVFTSLSDTSVHCFVVIEVKNCHGNALSRANSRKKAKMQVTRQVKGLSIMNPKAAFLGVVYTISHGFEPVLIEGQFVDWEQFELPFSTDLFGSP